MLAKRAYWTHPSVNALVEGSGRDPAEIVKQKAVEISLNAMKKGWRRLAASARGGRSPMGD